MSPRSLCLTAMMGLLIAVAAQSRTLAPEGAELYFISPADGAEITGTVTVRFGLRGLGVAPAGVEAANTGHHHLLINADPLPAFDQPLPSNEQVRHFGKGQTETDLDLAPGRYTLQLILGDAQHVPLDPPLLSAPITITVSP